MESDNPDNHHLSNKNNEEKQHFITDQNFNLLKECQLEIYKATDLTPSMRKIVNELITEENLRKVKSKLISIYKL
jgi:hypothetical protein